MTNDDELDRFVREQRAAAKLLPALEAQPATPRVALHMWKCLRDMLWKQCLEQKGTFDDFSLDICSDTEFKLLYRVRSSTFCLHAIFDSEPHRIRWQSGERKGELSIGIVQQWPVFLSTTHDPLYHPDEAVDLLYYELTWCRFLEAIEEERLMQQRARAVRSEWKRLRLSRSAARPKSQSS